MDLRLYFVTANIPELGRSHASTAAAAAAGGATVIQFRDKTMDDTEFEETARAIKKISDAAGIPLIINDRVQIGARIGATGIHAGQDDLSMDDIRGHVGPDVPVGCSVLNVEQAKRAESQGADYLGAGPVYPTASKDDAAPAIGVAELRRICRAVNIPVVAIGGINIDNIDEIIESGAAGAAVIAAVAGAPDMEKAASELRQKWEKK